MESFEKECSIRGYHVYKEIWEAAIGEELDCRREPSNASAIDRYAIADEGNNADNGPEGSGRLAGLRCCVT